jgi:uncharacterized repeat protein (TIGR01451 family)
MKTRYLTLTLLGALGLVLLMLAGLTYAGPIEPPEGYPKLKLSVKAVDPELAYTGGATLTYAIEIRNTGAYTAEGVTLLDPIPDNTTYNDDVWASAGTTPTLTNGALTWTGIVGFDRSVLVTFSVQVAPGYAGTVRNSATISAPLLAEAISVTAETVVTDVPILEIEKEAAPAKPGANKPLDYTLHVYNRGQPAVNLPITVTDHVPANTTLLDVGPDGTANPAEDVVTWYRTVDLDLHESTVLTFSVMVGDVPSGTVITNDTYQVTSAETGIAAGEAHTTTVLDPILHLSKSVWPDPPGSNREMTYTLLLFNQGSLATDLVITDGVPAGVTYVRGGTESGGVVSWTLASLDTGGVAELAYAVFISDVMGVEVVNQTYAVCSAEGVCAPGEVVSSVVRGPTFKVGAWIDPVAKKPGGGSDPELLVTPTLKLHNLGPGNGLDIYAHLMFNNISVSNKREVIVTPDRGTLEAGPGCGGECKSYVWHGDLFVGETITFTSEGQSTIGGTEGNRYTATLVVSDTFANGTVTDPITGVASGKVTHKANLVPTKRAPSVIGRGQLMTYTFKVINTALATDTPPWPYLWDFVPMSVTVEDISHGGVVHEISGTMFVGKVISWTLPAFGTGDDSVEPRWFSVRVDDDLVSGTQIVNRDYTTYWYEAEDGRFFTETGKPVTTTVVEVGLIDSFKEVTPLLAQPGPDNILTYTLHVVNSGPLPLKDVTVDDRLPWEVSTYQRDAVVDTGTLISDIVSFQWTGDVDAFSEVLITVTVLVDADYQGPVTNTAVISHPNLLAPVTVDAVAYITDQPVLDVRKHASPDPVARDGTLSYAIQVSNLGQQATDLVITDTLPSNVTYLAGSASPNGTVKDGVVQWTWPVLDPGASQTFNVQVIVDGAGSTVVNDDYAARCAEGAIAFGPPVVTRITSDQNRLYLPLVLRN